MPILEINLEEVTNHLEELLGQAEENVQEYEEFHSQHLANIRAMNPIDSFLYGIATGKKMILEDLLVSVKEYFSEMENGGEND